MILNKAQIEAVRYQLKKQGKTATNQEIRDCAVNFKDFDAVLIAEKIAASSPTDESMLPLLESSNELVPTQNINNEPQNSSLTTTQKQELVKIKSVELGITLTETEVIKIADMVESQIQDSIDFLNEVSVLISQFFSNRNSQARELVNNKVESIKRIINTKNEELGDIFNGANQELINVANECNKNSTDYKSTYKDKLESIREILKLPA
jgi:hypothetical protein